jgi:O-antigen/teichoic acid export membrane protein
MRISQVLLVKGAVWTVAWFGVSQALRVVTNIILARLLVPELFGIMQISNSLGMGVQLLSDIGVGQNIVYHQDANDPDFYNTAWSLQLIRGILLWLVFSACAVPIARFYQSTIFELIIPIAGFNIVLTGFTSTSIFLLQKRMKFSRLTGFNTVVGICSSAALVICAYFNPTIWALVYGSLAGTAISMVGSFFVLPDVRQRFFISRKYLFEMLSFGKWIFASSIVYFLSGNFDRLYLAKNIPLTLLGVYGIARALADMLSVLIVQVGYHVVFPVVASHSQMPRSELRNQLASIRMKFLFTTALGVSLLATVADLAIKICYDERYHAAGWMLPILVIGAWFSVLTSINESTLLGVGKPFYSALGNTAKFGFIVIGLSLSVGRFGVVGIMGAVLVVAASDLCRYMPILIGQIREQLSFRSQDVLATVCLFALIACWQWLRWLAGFGTSFDDLPIVAH